LSTGLVKYTEITRNSGCIEVKIDEEIRPAKIPPYVNNDVKTLSLFLSQRLETSGSLPRGIDFLLCCPYDNAK
jgi:hypothetical protein